MLTGMADKTRWADVVDAKPRDGKLLELGKMRWLQLTYEPTGDCRALFPAGLHLTNPVAITLQVWDVADGDLGPFRLAQVRMSCRAGVRVRALLLKSVINTPKAASQLSAGWGFSDQIGDIDLLWRTDRIDATVRVAGSSVLDMSLRTPASIGPDDLHHSVNVNMARCDGDLRLLQVDTHFQTQTVQRGKPQIKSCDASFWRIPQNPPTYPIIATAAEAILAITPVRYVQDPNLISQIGTKQIIENAA